MKKQKVEKSQEFLVISEDGYFTGLAYGGVPQWSMDISKAKPLDHQNQYITLKNICYNKELLTENYENS